VLSLGSPYRLHERIVRGSGFDGYEVDGLRLKEPGEDGAEEPGVVFAVAGATALLVVDRMAAAAAAGLHWTQTKTLNPLPSQLVQIAPLVNTSI
jgi:hypothetical protein